MNTTSEKDLKCIKLEKKVKYTYFKKVYLRNANFDLIYNKKYQRENSIRLKIKKRKETWEVLIKKFCHRISHEN